MSCEIRFTDDKKRAWLGESNMIKSFEKKCGQQVMWVWSQKTLAMPYFLIIRPINDKEKIMLETKNC